MSILEAEDAAEVARRGHELYESRHRARLERDERGKFLVLDVASGEYEIADDDTTATLRLLARLPHAETYGIRIGQDEAYAL